MKSTQFVCKETSAIGNVDDAVMPAPRFSDSYGHGDRENVFLRFGSFIDDRASMMMSGLNEKDLNEITGLMSPGSSSKGPRRTCCLNIPKVDVSTFCPLLGTKFFCFHPCNFDNVSEEIRSYLNCVLSNVNYDYDEVVHVWKCCENVDFEAAVFTISLFEDSTKDKIFVKFHRLSGSPSVFSSSVERFSRMACVASELKLVNPTDLSETKVTVQSIEEGSKSNKRRAFKALPLPLHLHQKSISSSEFISYCEIFNLWSHSDIPECLASLLSSMPKMWRDLIDFYEEVEKNPSNERMAELVTMFASINKIYKNLCAIALQSHNCMLNSEHPSAGGLSALTIQYTHAHHPAVIIADSTAAADYMGHSHDPNSYDYLDYDEVDASAGYANDHMYGAHAAANNHASRPAVTLDVTKSQYRSMTVFEEGARFTALKVDTQKPLQPLMAPTFEIDLNAKKPTNNKNNESLYSKFLQVTSPSGLTTSESTPEGFQFSDLLAMQSKEDLSTILYLSMACICEQFSCAEGEPDTVHHFDVSHYLTRLLRNNVEFTSVLQDIAQDECDPRLPVNSFCSFRSKDIKLYANQLNSLL